MGNATVVGSLVRKTYPTIHYTLPDVSVTAKQPLAEIAREKGIPHFVRLSTNPPASPTDSLGLPTKVLGEEAVREVFPSATVVRPTDMFGAEVRILNHLAEYVLLDPVFPLEGTGNRSCAAGVCCGRGQIHRRRSERPDGLSGQDARARRTGGAEDAGVLQVCDSRDGARRYAAPGVGDGLRDGDKA